MRFAVVGLMFGDEGKGSVTDYICSRFPIDWVVKPSSGCQTAHNVVTDNGLHHTFSQFGSGTFQGVPTYLGSQFMFEPLSFIAEGEHLGSLGLLPWSMVTVSEDCPVTTPYHKLLNRARVDAYLHGTCGRGVGETARYRRVARADDRILVGDLHSTGLRRKLAILQDWADTEAPGIELPPVSEVAAALKDTLGAYQICSWETSEEILQSNVCYEYSQGVLLDEYVGFHPHTTWAETCPRHIRVSFRSPVHIIGVTRSYGTRHGPGPFPSEGGVLVPDELHNDSDGHQGGFRTGLLDLVLLRYAAAAAGPFDSVAVTHADVPSSDTVVAYETPGGYLSGLTPPEKPYSVAYESRILPQQEALTRLLESARPVVAQAEDLSTKLRLIEASVGAKVGIVSYGPATGSKTLPGDSPLIDLMSQLETAEA